MSRPAPLTGKGIPRMRRIRHRKVLQFGQRLRLYHAGRSVQGRVRSCERPREGRHPAPQRWSAGHLRDRAGSRRQGPEGGSHPARLKAEDGWGAIAPRASAAGTPGGVFVLEGGRPRPPISHHNAFAASMVGGGTPALQNRKASFGFPQPTPPCQIGHRSRFAAREPRAIPTPNRSVIRSRPHC